MAGKLFERRASAFSFLLSFSACQLVTSDLTDEAIISSTRKLFITVGKFSRPLNIGRALLYAISGLGSLRLDVEIVAQRRTITGVLLS
jgi:hypothetical protein